MSVITIERKVLEKNDEIAGRNRKAFLSRRIFVFDLVSSPGAGKTSILECTAEELKGDLRMGVVAGDVQTDFDAQRVARYGIPAVQIVTRGGCHLDAKLVEDAVERLDLEGLDLLVLENVGNLVCPANYDLGEALKVVVLSTTEGEEKPLKYPAVFRRASVLVVNKIDLLPYVNCSLETLRENALSINPDLRIFETSCTTRAGIPEWCEWLKTRAAETH